MESNWVCKPFLRPGPLSISRESTEMNSIVFEEVFFLVCLSVSFIMLCFWLINCDFWSYVFRFLCMPCVHLYMSLELFLCLFVFLFICFVLFSSVCFYYIFFFSIFIFKRFLLKDGWVERFQALGGCGKWIIIRIYSIKFIFNLKREIINKLQFRLEAH